MSALEQSQRLPHSHDRQPIPLQNPSRKNGKTVGKIPAVFLASSRIFSGRGRNHESQLSAFTDSFLLYARCKKAALE